MSETRFPGLCSSNSKDWLLWSNKIGWDTPDPDITLCFQYTILNWIPQLYLWITAIIYIPILWKRNNFIYWRRGKFNIIKSVLIAFILFIHILNLCNTISDTVSNKFPPPALYLQSILSIISSILLIYMNRIIFLKGIHSSGVLFFYWMFQFAVNLIILYSRIRRLHTMDIDTFRTVTAILEFILVLISFIASFFADQTVFSDSLSSTTLKDFDETQPLLNLSDNESNLLNTPMPCPESKVSFPSKLVFIWLTSLMIKGYRKSLTFADLFALKESETCHIIIPKLEREWNRQVDKAEHPNMKPHKSDKHKSNYQSLKDQDFQELRNHTTNARQNEMRKKKTPSFLISIFHTIGYPFVLAGFFKFLYDALTFVQPMLLSVFIKFIEDPKDYVWHGYFFSMCLFLVSMIRSVIFQQYNHGCYLLGLRARTAVIGITYRKALKLSSSSRKEKTIGEIVNLMSVDSQKLQEVPSYLHFIWSAPLIIIVAIVLLWQQLGVSIMAGVALMVCLLPINGIIGSRIKILQNEQMKMKDNRMKLMSEILSGMKILKLYGWEESFEEKIQEIRNDECRVLRTATYLNAFSAVTWFCVPFLVALCTFAAYILSSPNNILTPDKAFVSLSLFNILSFPMSVLPGTIVYGVQAYVSLQRINRFLMGEELDPDNVEVSPPNEEPVKIINGTFSWGRNETPVLTDINLGIREGSLVAIVGTVGSGKTSLASALIGELCKISGNVLCRGSIAYVPQQAWCQNATLQDNIIFNKPMNTHRYSRVIEACALGQDLKILPAGDQTEIGEKGINLSGGQKQRISLARAVYQDSSIYLLDDPLSAVDSHVGKHIFNQVIGPNGLLAAKTRILITHALTHLPKVDKIIVMKDGQITESGTFGELLESNGPFADFIRTYLDQEEEEEVEEDSEDEARELKKELKQRISRFSNASDSEHELQRSNASNKFLFESKKSHRRQSSVRLSKSRSVLAEEAELELKLAKKKKLIQEELAETGGVKSGVFLSYIRSATYFFSLTVVLSYGLYIFSSAGANMFLSYWTETGNVNGTQVEGSTGYYLGIYGSLGISQTIFILIENLALAYGTFLASRSLHHMLLKSIMRAPNSFFDTTPLGRILNRIGKDIDTVDINIPMSIRIWLATATGVLSSIVVISIASPYFIIALVPLTFLYFIMQRFYIFSNRQLKRIDSIKRSPIYSHFQESLVGASSIRAYKVLDDFIEKCDLLTDENQMAWYPNILSYRWLQINLETLGNLVIIITSILAVVTRSTIGAGLAGLSISYSLQITSALAYMIRMTSDLEANTVSVERIQEYIDIEPEAPWDIYETKPGSEWPTRGEIEFVNYSVRYRPGLDLVLRNLNFQVEAGEKVGIVGRTGAGKSSLALALFRLIEPAEGSILIDGISIATLGLHDLRNKITIIPQDPVLFSGTLRMNLDPFNQYSDGELWSVLEMSYLKSFVVKTTEGLDYAISESGENLSIGQRQLVCLARALLKRTKVLVLDEATAAIDLETDDLIQSSIRRQFKTCTVLTIAHRLNTIMDYDKVMVLEQGRVKEMDTPQKLLANAKTVFFSMAQDAGLV